MHRELILTVIFVILALSRADHRSDSKCEETKCKLPNCRCASTSTPGGFSRHKTPQFVVFAFDGMIEHISMQTYRRFFYGAINANKCNSGVTFLINHERTNYMFVNELYNMGFEIGLNSMTNGNETYFKDADLETMMLEFSDQRKQVAHFAQIPIETIQGMRIPNLQMNGDISFQMMQKAGLRYDMSWPTVKYQDPGLWPYTLDYASTQDCVNPPCPTSSFPGQWVVPMVSWTDLDGEPCITIDHCKNVPTDYYNQTSWFQFMANNFNRHYVGNRAPFGFFIKESTFRNHPGFTGGLMRFIVMLNNLYDVHMVNVSELLDWMQNPIPLEEYFNKPCSRRNFERCSNSFCGPLIATHREEDMYLSACSSCPRVFPWLGNPFGY